MPNVIAVGQADNNTPPPRHTLDSYVAAMRTAEVWKASRA
jgi:hypothetical protein